MSLFMQVWLVSTGVLLGLFALVASAQRASAEVRGLWRRARPVLPAPVAGASTA